MWMGIGRETGLLDEAQWHDVAERPLAAVDEDATTIA